MKKFFTVFAVFLIAALFVGAPRVMAATTIWFYNSDGWSDVSCYTWADGGDLTAPWPGVKAERDGSTDWWSCTINEALPFNVIFNNSGGGAQGGNVYFEDASKPYLTVDADLTYANRADAEQVKKTAEKKEISGKTTKILFYNAQNWETVYVYAYNTETNEALGGWPGTAANKDGAWYSAEVPSSAPFNIIFHDGIDVNRTESYVSDSENVYFIPRNDAVFTSKEAAESAYAGGKENPETGDTSFAALIFALGACGMSAILLRTMKRQSKIKSS